MPMTASSREILWPHSTMCDRFATRSTSFQKKRSKRRSLSTGGSRAVSSRSSSGSSKRNVASVTPLGTRGKPSSAPFRFCSATSPLWRSAFRIYVPGSAPFRHSWSTLQPRFESLPSRGRRARWTSATERSRFSSPGTGLRSERGRTAMALIGLGPSVTCDSASLSSRAEA